ncbi:MAG: hypothetical protein ABUS79_04860 [Pseudomonadota bacterium]
MLPDSAAPPDAGSDGVPQETGTIELPRTDADPRLTRKLLAGAVTLVGDRETACTIPPAIDAPPAWERWCAFARKADGDADRTELWVVNVSKAAAGGAVACDGTSAGCLRLTVDLWTSFQIWGPAHPSSHHFEGETLIFYAGPTPGARDPYEGAVWGWRPGWPSAQKLTSDKGALCGAQPPSTTVWCLADVTVERDSGDPFAIPIFREFDLLAGSLSAPGSAPLAKVARLGHAIPGFDWRVRLSGDGAYLAYSTAPMKGGPEALQMIKTADIGKVLPTTIAADVAQWDLSRDGERLYSIAGYDRGLGKDATGTLVAVDFPSGARVTELKRSVAGYELIGPHGQPASHAARALLVQYDDGDASVGAAGGGRRVALMPDTRVPTDTAALDVQGRSFQVSTDLRHTMYLKPMPRNPVLMVSRNDGSGGCQLTSDNNAESYNERFTDNGRLVTWVEFGRNQSVSEEGWYGRPDNCGGKTKFGDYVLGYQLVADDFVVFQGGDFDDSTSWLQYASLRENAAGAAVLPAVIKQNPDITFSAFKDAGAAAWVVFSLSGGDASENGLYIHGPLAAPP